MEHGCKKPRGCLMIEHRLIERAIAFMKDEKERLETGGELNPVTIDTLADFIKTYADRTHHGKEEDILFEDLEARSLNDNERELMEELIEEHKLGRNLTKQLVGAKDEVVSGDRRDLKEVISAMQALIDFYPQHIEKEDKRFFPDTERHYSQEELDEMVREFYAFDRGMIHEKYTAVADELAGKR
jgi:hemerythrin-like domain-containing protein